MKVSGARYIVNHLAEQGVEVVFGYPGGAIMPLYDALIEAPFKHVLTRHEQGAALAADGYARASGRVGVCMATSGPGATNLVTGIANAFLDSIPMVAITGQVASPLIGTDAFQEVDVLGITLPVVKHNFLVTEPSELPRVLSEAFRLAGEGRPGPVLVDIAKDAMINEFEVVPHHLAEDRAEIASQSTLERARQLLAEAKKPVLYCGGGIVLSESTEAVRRFVDITQIPTVSTLKALGVVPASHPMWLGMLGMHGTKQANFAVHDCDLLICVGARFDDRATGKLAEFAANANIIHLDIDPAEINKLKQTTISLIGDLANSLSRLQMPLHNIDEWREECLENKMQHAWRYDAPGKGIYAPKLLNQLSQMCDSQTHISCDVGQHQMWVAQHYRFSQPRQHLTSGGLGTMGYGLPAAIGAKYANPEAHSIVVSGDGSIMMNIQELATLKRYGIPVKIILFDNQVLGMVRQWQELFFAERYSEIDLSDNPEFTQVAQAFGIKARYIDRADQVEEALEALLAEPEAMLLHVKIDAKENVWPLVPPGKANAAMLDGKKGLDGEKGLDGKNGLDAKKGLDGENAA